MSTILTSSKEAVQALLSEPLALAALIIVFALIVFVLVIRKIKLTPLLMAQIGISVAICAVLNAIPLFQMPQGGSVTLASTLPIIIMAFAYGPEVGMLTGFLFGVVNLFLGPFIIHPLQTLLDYPLPFMFVGMAGFFKNRYVGTVISQLLRLLMHVLSGVIFFDRRDIFHAGKISERLIVLFRFDKLYADMQRQQGRTDFQQLFFCRWIK